MQATVKDLRFQARELLETVKRGEEVGYHRSWKTLRKNNPAEVAKNQKKSDG